MVSPEGRSRRWSRAYARPPLEPASPTRRRSMPGFAVFTGQPRPTASSAIHSSRQSGRGGGATDAKLPFREVHDSRKDLLESGLALLIETGVAVFFEGRSDLLPVVARQVFLAFRDHALFLRIHVLPDELGVSIGRLRQR